MKISKNYSKPNILIISGATATGKTSWSLKIARKIQAIGKKVAIINFDSLLFYKELNIGTAKPSSKELSEVDHYLINTCSAKNKMNASLFRQEALKIIQKLSPDHYIILVGGSAFYLRALIKGMYNNDITEQIDNLAQELFLKQGITPFIDYLEISDPQSLKLFHQNDHYRIIRAYQFHKKFGKLYSDEKIKQDKLSPYDFSQNLAVDWEIEHHYLQIPKDQHWIIIEQRAKSMIKNGLINEVKSLLNLGFNIQDSPLQSIGYKETISYLDGVIKTKDDLIEQIFISTRQLAKSQKTFFKKITPKVSFNPLLDHSPPLNLE